MVRLPDGRWKDSAARETERQQSNAVAGKLTMPTDRVGMTPSVVRRNRKSEEVGTGQDQNRVIWIKYPIPLNKPT
jgi:hypothetical protein